MRAMVWWQSVTDVDKVLPPKPESVRSNELQGFFVSDNIHRIRKCVPGLVRRERNKDKHTDMSDNKGGLVQQRQERVGRQHTVSALYLVVGGVVF